MKTLNCFYKLKFTVIPKLRGFRDCLPDYQASRRKMMDTVLKIPPQWGYKEISFPSLEHLDLFRKKSGLAIMNETFSFMDKGGREVTLIPEATPSVARMVANAIRSYKLPLRWYSYQKFWRYEEPQSGRQREFYQMNVDCFGVSNIRADAELINMAIETLRAQQLTSKFKLLISDRRILEDEFDLLGIKEKKLVLQILDKHGKISNRQMRSELFVIIKDDVIIDQLEFLISIKKPLPEAIEILENKSNLAKFVNELKDLANLLSSYGTLDSCIVDLSLVRGFDYYTGIVFEAFYNMNEMPRSILGGGRYDNLIELFGGPPTSAVGFAMGDIVIEEIMRKEKLWPEVDILADFYVICVSPENRDFAIKVETTLRSVGCSVESEIAARTLSKGLKYANSVGIKHVIIIGDKEVQSGNLVIRNMITGKQDDLHISELGTFAQSHKSK